MTGEPEARISVAGSETPSSLCRSRAGACILPGMGFQQPLPRERHHEPVDVHKVAEQTMAALDAWVTKAGHVEVEVVVGEEPEEGVEFEVHGVRWDESLVERPDPVCDETQCGFHHDRRDPACVRAKHRGRAAR